MLLGLSLQLVPLNLSGNAPLNNASRIGPYALFLYCIFLLISVSFVINTVH